MHSVAILFPFLRSYRPSIIVALALMFTEVAVELCSPLILAHLIDDGIVPGDLSTVLRWGALLFALAVVSFACGIVNTFFAADVGQGIAHDLRAALFKRLIGMDAAQFQRFHVSSLITRLTGDINQVQSAVFLLLRIYLRAPLLIVGSVVLALTVDVTLALILVVVTPVALWLTAWVMRRGFLLFNEVQTRVDRINKLVGENLVGMRLIRSFVRADHESARFATANRELMEHATTSMRLPEVWMPLLLLMMNLSVLVVLWFGQHKIALEHMQVGAVLAVLNYAVRVTVAYNFIAMIVTNLTTARTALHRAAEILTPPLAGSLAQISPAQQVLPRELGLQFNAVHFSYPHTTKSALTDIAFNVTAGQTIAIMGATGAGKSTLLQLAAQLVEPTQGSISFACRDSRQCDAAALRAAIGLVPQETLLFSGTIRDNLIWGNPAATQPQIDAATRAAQIRDTILALPQQYDTVVAQKGGNLSGGQKQRVTIARALLRQPSLLLLDDCTSALDATTEARLLAALREQRCTTLLATQKASVAKAADAVLLLDAGRIVGFDKHTNLLATSPLYRTIVQSQQSRGEAAAVHGYPHEA